MFSRKPNFRIWVMLAAMVCAASVAAIVPALRWRTLVVARKVVGQLQDVSWADLVDLERPGSGVELKHLVRTGNPYLSLQIPATSEAQIRRGKDLFADTCARCHGAGAVGGAAPRLFGRALPYGNSDWALYRTITYGIPSTAMQGGLLARRDVWNVIAYLHALNGHGRDAGAFPQANGERSAGAFEAVTGVSLVEAATKPGDWLLPYGSYRGQRFSSDAQVNAGNVAHLKAQWIHQLTAPESPNESTPIVIGNYMFVTAPPSTVIALDARSGKEIWQFARPMPADLRLCCLATNRGVAVLGTNVYVATLDAHLIALDAVTGKLVWDTRVADYAQGFSMTSAPLAVGDEIVVGIGGGDFPIRGFISAYDARTGALRWRLHTIPGPGEPGHDTWSGDSWTTGGGATWGIGSYDPELGLIYWGVGNPAPDWNAAARPGDNLYTNSVLAVDAAKGKIAWHFQFSPGDDHDWDSIQTPALIDVRENGVVRKLLAVANRNGFFYTLDRSTGRFVGAVPFAKQTWATGLTPTGRPIRAANSRPSKGGTYIYPSVTGATNWWPSAFSPLTGLYYVDATERGGLFFGTEPAPRPTSGRLYVAGSTRFVDGEPFFDYVRAIDPVSLRVRWQRLNATATSGPRGGLLATGGGLLFGSDGPVIYALDAATGRELWTFDTGAQISAPPITYRLGGKQIIAVVAGHDVDTFMLADDAR